MGALRQHAIDVEIITLLRSRGLPTSTRDLSVQTGRAWHSIQTHCLRLQLDGKVDGFSVGGMNLWQLKRR
ncbi:hypothetical protein HY642_04590 [Candidatus Woesearchaeota archaeon]|nr:hypothetical protein [Candidatus Woesearchaeota archaeon]